MFSSILKSVTDYFDRRSTLSTFFPLLLFWSIVTAVVFSHYLGWSGTLVRWNKLSGTAQALLIVAFLAWVALTTFFTLNIRGSLLRLFEGQMMGPAALDRLVAWRRRRWGNAMAALEARDAGFAEREALLRAEARVWEAFPPDDVLTEIPVPPVPVADLAARAADTGLGDEVLADLGRDVRYAALAGASTSAADKERLAALVSHLQDEVERRLQAVRAERAVIHYRLSRYFPQHAVVAPTRLGNAMRAVETYGRPRYGLDMATIWPRLQPLLPAETVSWLEQAGVAFELMLTLSALSGLFGTALGVYLAVISSSAQAATVAAVVIAGSLLLSWACYRNAVEAAVTYGERVRSVVDLHRFKVLDAMSLSRPENLADEDLQWRRVCGLLDRSDRADPAAWRYQQPAKEGGDG